MKIRENFYTSYKTHNHCNNCEDGHKSGWILKTKCIGIWCPNCGSKLRTKTKGRRKYEGGRY
jgi:hypothetical protein